LHNNSFLLLSSYGVRQKIAGNGTGLGVVGEIEFRPPEPLLIEKLMMKITTKSQIEFRQAGTKAP
jgi:hypothetical protein